MSICLSKLLFAPRGLIRRRDLEESAFRHAFNSQLDTALLLVSSKAKGAMNPLAGSKGTPTQHAYFQVPTTLLKLCQGMQTRYEQLSEMVDNAKPEAILGQPWQQDHEKLAQLLEIGHRVAERQIDELVQRDAQNMDTKAQVVVSDEDEQEAVEVLGMRVAGQDKKIPAIPWDESLRHAEHGVRRFTRGLPEEAE